MQNLRFKLNWLRLRLIMRRNIRLDLFTLKTIEALCYIIYLIKLGEK